jgi:hypothetical protein
MADTWYKCILVEKGNQLYIISSLTIWRDQRLIICFYRLYRTYRAEYCTVPYSVNTIFITNLAHLHLTGLYCTVSNSVIPWISLWGTDEHLQCTNEELRLTTWVYSNEVMTCFHKECVISDVAEKKLTIGKNETSIYFIYFFFNRGSDRFLM